MRRCTGKSKYEDIMVGVAGVSMLACVVLCEMDVLHPCGFHFFENGAWNPGFSTCVAPTSRDATRQITIPPPSPR